jgi:hypothetical protein
MVPARSSCILHLSANIRHLVCGCHPGWFRLRWPRLRAEKDRAITVRLAILN